MKGFVIGALLMMVWSLAGAATVGKVDKNLTEMRAKISALKEYVVIFKSVDNNGTVLMNGEISVMNNTKYHLKTNAGETWFDGKTLWNYSSENNEVTIDEPKNENAILANPQKLLSLDSDNITESVFQGKEEKKGRSVNVSRVVLNNEGVKFIIMLYVDQETKLPLEMNISSEDGEYEFNIVVEKFKTDVSLKDIDFKFEPKKYPKTEIIDFR